MKKSIALLMAMLMLFSFAGCSTKETGEPAAPAAPAPEKAIEETEPPKEEAPAEEAVPEAEPPMEEPPAPEFAIEALTIGTTASIEKAVRDEYSFDMLASAVSEPPLVYQDLEGKYHPLLASYETGDGLSWTFTIQDGF